MPNTLATWELSRVVRLVTAFLWTSAWPDLIVGLSITAMNADAAREVWTTAREEHRGEIGKP